LFRHAVDKADVFARLRAGNKIAARIATIAITMSSSTRVNAHGQVLPGQPKVGFGFTDSLVLDIAGRLND
jgi:hypothetical protein